MRLFLVSLLALTIIYLAFVVMMRLAFPLPSLADRPASTATVSSDQTLLGRIAARYARPHQTESGFLSLPGGVDAYATRVALARAAEESIDARYYIWQDDMTGIVLLDALREAAMRGVRVRLLVDDNGIPGLDDTLAALDALPTMEVRIFNPFQIRSPKSLSFLFDLFRLNRRMHNKSFSVDGAFAVIGGRNIGNVYFENGSDGIYFDLDVLTTGASLQALDRDFDRYWESQSAFPANLILTIPDPQSQRDTFAEKAAETLSSDAFKGYAAALRDSAFVASLQAQSVPFIWANATLYSDDPAKGLIRLPKGQQLIARLFGEMPAPEHSFDLVSAYFIPGEFGSTLMTGYAQSGVTVQTMTNSLEATDVASVHSGYAKYRDDLLAGGVKVYELRSQIDGRQIVDDFGVLGSATSSLHAKAFAIDGKRLFIGSFNFDPRSALLNCEMGFLIESPEMAANFSQRFNTLGVAASYQVEQAENGDLTWYEPQLTGPPVTYETEPGTTWAQRSLIKIMGWLPIEWML